MSPASLAGRVLITASAIALVALRPPPTVAGELENPLGTASKIRDPRNRIGSSEAAPAQAMTAGDLPGSWKLPGTDTSVALHGYVKADAIYTLGAPHSVVGDSFAVSMIPLDGSRAENQGDDVRFHARQSRVRIDTSTPTEHGALKTRIETDFFGAAGEQGFANADGMRIRHAWASIGPLLAGQTFSTFEDQDTIPDAIDFFGPIGAKQVFQGQLRYTAQLGDTLSLDAAVENPEQSNVTSGGTSNVGVVDRHPDYAAALRYRDSWGAAHLAAVLRNFSYDDGRGAADRTWGYGVRLGGHAKLDGKDRLGFTLKLGDGLGRYLRGAAAEVAVRCAQALPQGAAAFAPGCGAELETQFT